MNYYNNCKDYSKLAPTSCASLIIRDVMKDGISFGWSGHMRDLAYLKNLLNTFHVKCISDSFGYCHFEH